MSNAMNENACEFERLNRLETSSLAALRQAVSHCARPAMLFSAGKDSCVMLHLARKAFAPNIPTFPLLHVDTTWEFPETHPFRDRMAESAGMALIVQVNRDGARRRVGPFTHGAKEHTRLMKSAALTEALDTYGFDAVMDGARGDEKRLRGRSGVGTAGSQTPTELQARGNPAPERFFPLADWTEMDVWRYIEREGIEIPDLYFAAPRWVVERNGMLIVRVDERMPLEQGEEPQLRSVRFRSLGCWPLTGAVESRANDIPAIVRELRQAGTLERQGRAEDLGKGSAGNAQGDYF